MGNAEQDSPVITIQCDWEDFIFTTKQEVWVSCKYRGKESVHSKLRGQGMNSPICSSDDFTVISVTKDALYIKHNSSGTICAFVPPSKTFSLHKKKVVSLNVTDGGLGVSACAENKLLVWNSDTGELQRTLEGHVCNVYKCKYFPSGIVVLSGGADMQLKIWSAETGQCPVTLRGHKAAVHDFCIVDRGRNIISVSKDGTAKLWDCGLSACLATIMESSDTLNCCSIGLIPNNVTVERVTPVSEREIGTKDKLLIIGSEEGLVYGVAVFNRKVIFSVNVESAVNVVLHLSNQFMVGCQNGKILIYNFTDISNPAKVIYESNSPVLSGCAFKQNGFFIGRNDGTVTYYDRVGYSSKKVVLTGSDCDPIYDLACGCENIFTACRDGKIRKYKVNDVIKNCFQS